MKINLTKTFLILISINCCLSNSFAQGENDNWIFGYGCHVSFKTDKPVAQKNLKTISTGEGCTSVSSKNGDLLFYSDGVTIWTKDHQVMANGSGLSGDYSSTSSCVIVPYPDHPKQYYVFCTDAVISTSLQNGLTYNIVDLSYHNGSGEVVIKNQTLVRSTDEKIAVTRHCNGKDFWIVTHQSKSENFYAFLLNNQGLEKIPVITKINESLSKLAEIGYLKFTPDGNWLVNTQCVGQKLEIYQFDRSTARISLYAFDDSLYSGTKQTYYGLAFSANSQKLYVSNMDAGTLYQYDLNDPAKKIFQNRILLSDFSHRIGALQLARDNKIYISDGDDSHFLNIIRNPELKGALCSLKIHAFNLGPYNTCQMGLPTYVESMDKYFAIKTDSIINQNGCILDATIANAIYKWSTGETTRSINIFLAGTYWVEVTEPNSCTLMRDTIQVIFKDSDLKLINEGPLTISVCEKGQIKIPVFLSDSSGVQYFWTNSNPAIGLPANGTGQINSFSAPGVNVTTQGKITILPVKGNRLGKPYTIYITIHPIPEIITEDIKDISICGGTIFKQVMLKSIPAGAVFTWRNSNPEIGLTANGKGHIKTFLSTRSNRDQMAKISMQAEFNQCKSDSQTFQVLIKAIPVTAYHPDIIRCSNQIFPSIYFSSTPAGSEVYWISDSSDIKIPVSGMNQIPSFYSKNNKESHTRVTYFPILNQCAGDSLRISINVAEVPKIMNNIHKTIALCGGSILKIDSFAGLHKGTTIRWNNSNSQIGLKAYGEGNIKPFISNKSKTEKSAKIIIRTSLNNCAGDSGIIHVLLKATPEAIRQNDIELCGGDIFQETGLHGLPEGTKIKWSSDNQQSGIGASGENNIPAFTLQNRKAVASTRLSYYPEFKGCIGDSQNFMIIVNPKPNALFLIKDSSRSYLSDPNHLQFVNQSTVANSFYWNFGDGQYSIDKDPAHTFNENKSYNILLTAENEFGCTDTAIRILDLRKNCPFYIPDAFSPDNNNKNEIFRVHADPTAMIQFWIYNRWGEQLYYTPDNTGWNGSYNNTICEEGVYLYKVKATDLTKKSYEFSGTVTLFR